MKKLPIILIGLLCLFFSKAFAQGSATGCYTSWDNAVHTSGPRNGVYSNMTGRVGLSANYCSWTPTVTSSPCQVCTGVVVTTTGPNFGKCQISDTNATPMPTVAGYVGTFTMVKCPLDNYVWLTLCLLGFAGVLALRGHPYLI